MTSRRRQFVIVAILAAVVGSFAPGTAQPARAAVYNPIPADASENPNDSFSSNQSLWAWFTADIAGGRICVVHADVFGTCDHPAMGHARFIGATVGLAFTLIANAPLRPGRFQLLTENSLGDSLRRSFVFTVSACGDGCPLNLDFQIVQEFKATATRMAAAFEKPCTFHFVLEAVAGRAIGMRGIDHDLTYGDHGFTIQDPLTANINKGLDILHDISCGAQKMYESIAADPPDAGFDVIATPDPQSVGSLQPASLQAVAESVEMERALSEAALHALERYQGALAAGDAAAQVAQLEALGGNVLNLSHEIGLTARVLRTWTTEAPLDPDLDRVMLGAADAPILKALYARVLGTGFSPAEIDQFHGFGYTDGQIAAIRVRASRGIDAMPIDTTYADAMAGLADGIEMEIEAMADFAGAAFALAASLAANLGPDAAFSADPISGGAPLEVTFTSSATDPNGDSLTLNWDFGDGATDHGPSVPHIYAAAGTYTATLIASDGRVSDSASATIVVGGNRAPRTVDDAAATVVETSVDIDVLANDEDPDGDPLTISGSDGSSAGGGAVVCGDTCTYTPPAGRYGTDLFRYTVADGAGGTATGTVRVTISTVATPINEAPFARPDVRSVQFGESAEIDVLENDVDPDGDPLTIADFTPLSALGGSIACALRCTYRPPPRTYGTDVFTYTISDGNGGVAATTVVITIEPPTLNERPTAVDDSAATVVDQAVLIDVLANDTDRDGDLLQIVDWDSTSAGGGSVSGGTRLMYTPPAGMAGSDQFTYRVADGQGGSDVGLVTVTITHALPGAAAFTVQPAVGFAPLPVRFDATASASPDIASFAWAFGDGTAAMGPVVSHTYARSGGYEATLTITDDAGRTATRTANVDVRAPSSLAIPVCGDAGTTGEPIVFRCPEYSPLVAVQSFELAGVGPVDVRFDYAYRASAFANELAVFTIDDALGSVGGRYPGEAGYLRAALTRARVIFATGSGADAADTTLDFEGGDRLVFVVIPQGTLSGQLLRPDDLVGNDVVFSMDRLNSDGGLRHLFGFRHRSNGSVQFGFEDILGDAWGDFDDVVFNAYAAFRSGAPLSVAITSESTAGEPGSANGYHLTVANPLGTDVEVAAIVDVLPEGFAYTPGSSTGVTTAEPSVTGRVLRWTGPFTIPSGTRVTLHFGVTLAIEPGTYLTAAGVVSAVAATGSGPSAAIVVRDDVEPPNTTPSLATIADQSTPEEAPFAYTLSATDPDPGQNLTFELVSGPAGLQVSPAGAVTWTPTEAQGPSSYDVTVRVIDDGAPALSDEAAFAIVVTDVNRPPVLDPIADLRSSPGELTSATATARDPDLPANILSYSLVAGPSGAAIDPTTGAFSWTSAAADLGDHPVTIAVGDGQGGSAIRSFVIHVAKVETTLSLEGASAGQYSDRATIGARLVADSIPIAGATVSISLGATTFPATTDATGFASATFALSGPAATLAMAAEFGGTVSLAGSSVSGTFAEGREDATLVYSGAGIGLTGATLELSAIFADSASAGFAGLNPESAGATVGDITSARVAFAIWPAASCLTGAPLVTVTAAVIDSAPTGDGIGRAGTTWSSQSEGSFCVVPSLVGTAGTGVNAHYAAPPATPAGLAVYADAIGKVTGGGWIGLASGRANFGFNASSFKGRVKGNLVFVARTTFEGTKAILVIRSNAIEGLKTNGSAPPLSVILTGKASFKYLSSADGSVLFESGNATFTATVTDGGGNAGDTFALRALDKAGGVLVDVGATALGGGNVVAHLK